MEVEVTLFFFLGGRVAVIIFAVANSCPLPSSLIATSTSNCEVAMGALCGTLLAISWYALLQQRWETQRLWCQRDCPRLMNDGVLNGMMQIMKASPKMEVWKTNFNFCQKGMLCIYRSLQMCEFKTGLFNFHSECKMFHHGESRWVQLSCLVLILCFFPLPLN